MISETTEFKSICVAGLGYIGLPTAALFAKSGIQVFGYDVNPSTVEIINNGQAHIKEVDLDGLIQGVTANGMLTASTKPSKADVYILCVPTPFSDNQKPDLSFLEQVLDDIAPLIKVGDLIIIESTVPPGTTRNICTLLEEKRPDLKEAGGAGTAYYAAHCPERVLPGRILIELVQNDRIIGGMTEPCADKARNLYETVVRGECFLTTSQTAELAKLSENAFRDVNIAFANELSVIAGKLDIDVWELISLANKHPRVNILNPGPGVGGHCIAVDPWFIVDAAPEETKLIKTARSINDSMPQNVVERIQTAAEKLKTPKIACLGLAFKADIDDLRSSPALEITEKLACNDSYEVLAVEPNIKHLPSSLQNGNVEFTSLQDALKRADIVALLVDHTQFKRINRKQLLDKIIIDTRGLWS
ncbi:UDP-N-acetyl-D-mannosamine dehydrogenase [Kordiimonas sp. SCSIO 12610]|uniref:UDP-N-acetyl-D-mannosamine dehydrogenase n=1 Tax=Kordiimonas sp. SCSIO 12610 TaxID=2829597 RepID=UPI00210C7E23|nr:UDP-N-acetyl-D-mannosamine dehydrogenase [Kordiimonas sp. SCSIO 12610]UTW54406.1 UDP-N-acetyl-D-mannosamine dehydrogenase [Kordiimonas sp. SCSIO 12610]